MISLIATRCVQFEVKAWLLVLRQGIPTGFSKDQALHQLGSSSSWMGKVESVGLVDEIRDY